MREGARFDLTRAAWVFLALLLRLLRDLGAAPRVPAPVLTQALEYGVRSGRREIVAAAAAARPRAVALQRAELDALDAWMARAGK